MNTAWGQLLVQDFSTNLASFSNSTVTTGTYASATPNNTQFTALASSGIGMTIDVSSGTLNFVRTGNSGAFVRNVNFSPTPSALHIQFDLNVTTTASATSAATMYVGQSQTNDNATPPNANVHSRLAFNFVNANQFRLRDVAGGTNAPNAYSGTQTITWVINNSGATLTYSAPDGTSETVADDRWDVWVGTSRELNEASVTTSTVPLNQIKFLFSGEVGTMNFDNLIIQPLDVQFRSKTSGNLNATASWEASLDGSTWYNANFFPSISSNAIQIQNGHNITVTNNITLDQLTINSGGTLTVNNGVTLTANDGTGTDITVNGTLNTNTTGVVLGSGSFTLGSGATLRTANTSGVSASIIVSGTQTYNAGANYEFNNPSANQDAGFPTGVTTMNNLIINTGAANRVNLNKNITVSGTVTLIQGDLNLNGFNISLGSTGSIAENIASQHLIKDLTATTDTGVKGGYIEATGRTVNTGTTQIAGLGVYLQTSAGSYNDLQVRRYHYTANNGVGIRLVYQLSSPSVGTNPTTIGFRMPTAEENPNSLTLNRIYRWSSMLGWEFIATSVSCTSLGSPICTNSAQTTFSSWSLGNDSNAQLPITLLSFKAERTYLTSPEVRLTWQTAQEINNKGFEIEFSPDLKEFTKIAFADGAGSTNIPKNYTLNINNPLAGYYRLKQIDFDGSYEYSPVAFVEKAQNYTQISLYPNPIAEVIHLDGLEPNQKYAFKIQNVQGQLIQHTEGTQEQASQNLSQIFKNQKTGVYFIQIIGGGKPITTLKVVKQ
ncbi:MAG: T9SS type A sorting domain-containing protein [Bacteroidia bacterium]|nr:T9SS type A sorting domain-containing protein [Bacteroidia bacterium]